MKQIFALGLALLPLPAAADDYLGILKPPQTSLQPLGVYSFASAPSPGFAPLFAAENGYKFKLGYKYSRYFAVEGEFADFARPLDAFANPANLSSSFRGTGFGVDTVATLPLWRFSFYGRMGAYRGDRNGFSAYGLGMRYDFTQSFGVRAELERHSLGLGSPLAGDLDSDQVTVGISWRF